MPPETVRLSPVMKPAASEARKATASAFACLDAASMTWVANDGKGEIIDLYDECMAAVRG
jgi:hypothetical protein